MKQELEKLYDHVDDIEVAMMTTRRADGHLQSRAMATQKRAEGADLWFVTLEGTRKLRDLADDRHVNLSYYKDRTREWISVSGIATVTNDRETAAELSLFSSVEFALWDAQMREVVEPGLVDIHAGPSSVDLKTVTLEIA